MSGATTGRTWLFVPGDRPERFARAAASGADHVVLDLEDSVAADRKDVARSAVVDHLRTGARCWVRLNGADSPWQSDDLAALSSALPEGVMTPKAETPDALTAIADLWGTSVGIVPLIESARGLAAAEALAACPGVARLAFGSVDFALDIGADHDPEALLFARSRLVLASRLAEVGAPLDGVTMLIDAEAAGADARRARRLGMGGKLCIHPVQVAAVQAAFRPSADEIELARRVVEAAAQSTHGAVALDGRLIDRPVVDRARRVLAEAEPSSPSAPGPTS